MNEIRELLEPGTLWQRVLDATERAKRRGALVSIPTRAVTVEDRGVRFHVRVVASLERKRAEREHPDIFRSRTPANPFLPYEPDMFVVDLGETHVCLLNKYNVVPHHVLMVTRGFQHQREPLDVADFRALCTCLAEYPGLVFYNAGVVAGASQRHKHLQMVAASELTPKDRPRRAHSFPARADSGGLDLPISPMLDRLALSEAPCRIPELPFEHQVVRFACPLGADLVEDAHRVHAVYRAMLTGLGLEHFVPDPLDEETLPDRDPLPPTATAPYNLLCTRDWIMMVPRTRECFEGVSINALGFAGALLVRNEEELRRLERLGPMRALEHTGRKLPVHG